MERQPFAVTLRAKPSYRLGEPVLISFTIENTSAEAVQVLDWGTPLEERFTVDWLIVKRDGEVVPYDGMLVKRADPPSSAYRVLEPGEQLVRDMDITEAYSIDRIGIYQVTLNATFFDAFFLPANIKQPARRLSNQQPHQLPPDTVVFSVHEGATPKLTSGQAARNAPKLAKSSAKAPNFNGGTANEQADTIIAHGNAQHFSGLAVKQLNAGPASTNLEYQTWFGAFDQDRYDKVTKHYTDISNSLLNDSRTYDLTGTGCQAGWFAYTHKGDDTVWLCSGYLSAAQMGTDCKFGTLVHEWSHAVSGTDDNAYGETACQALAKNNPGKATNNADSHEYFTEHLAQSNFGKSLIS